MKSFGDDVSPGSYRIVPYPFSGTSLYNQT